MDSRRSRRSIRTGVTEFFYVDVDGDGSLAPVDVIRVINFVNDLTGNPEGEGSRDVATPLTERATFNNVNSSSMALNSEAARKRNSGGSATTGISIEHTPPSDTSSGVNSARETNLTESHDEYARALDELLQDDFSPLHDLFFD